MSERESKRPPAGDFYQQRMKAWQPIMTPTWVIGTFLFVGLVFITIGVPLKMASDGVVEYVIQYDGEGTQDQNKACMLADDKQSTICELSFNVDKDMEAPIYVYYQLHNFYQNHRRYVKSRNDDQLAGALLTADDVSSSCDPQTTTESGELLNPCGLIANSMFNDKFDLQSGPANSELITSNIAWASDKSNKFANPDNFRSAGTKWLYQTYPDIINEIQDPNPNSAGHNGAGVKNEHFIVWMRTAALSTFRKLYGKIDVSIPANTVVKFNVSANFRVDTFGGRKALVMSTTSWLGGKNTFLPVAYFFVGSVCIVLALLFLAKQMISPRELGDTSYLVWKNRG